MEINLKGGLVSLGLIALSGYVLYLKGRSDANKAIIDEMSKRFKRDDNVN
jgi:hypothetical protein